MRLCLVALGHRMPAWVSAGYEDYARRLPREFALALIELKPEPRDRGRTVGQMLDAEAKRIAAATEGYASVALDEHGSRWSTRELADHLRQWHDGGRDVAFVIGSADGLHPDVKANALAVVSLSAMTLPHGLARVLIAEQLYRASSILAGHPYHRE
ncbi:MAG: 23S rRNA (pseudouridine(1915)-N(3))-methyltransferase RlmH [Betaproteobacteria bacterium]|nr:23S rRNA (pseudouridine(1915)-N(3))-methyltransferase RlmH [Betaproteobacteria bacterium]MDE2002644.1 23S rRNA (pseudouridine(1915)-N(3))-methyltransferase RlmH [Betaproteobacteria bacterium]MDE2209532.1 23S rRNA (pseudouridine(1915)-N(3))-methyltransferase RlmH [Betaproteobacteria bacterium]MDE2359600.1 23S rRNA (pseudouridine(1915)-N(3))-methyltransferase RlmH [Betaproteobacteria bacterium]